MAATVLYLTRHGETEWNVQKKLQGHRDSPLTAMGVWQARWLSDALADVRLKAIYASSSRRTAHTAEIIRGGRDIPLHLDDNLREINMGVWEGRKGDEIMDSEPEDYHSFWNTPHLFKPRNGGESYEELRERVIPLVDQIVSSHRGAAVMIVTHAAALKLIMSHLLGRPLEELWHPPFIHPTALCKVVIEEGEPPKIELYGDTSHYRSSGPVLRGPERPETDR